MNRKLIPRRVALGQRINLGYRLRRVKPLYDLSQCVILRIRYLDECSCVFLEHTFTRCCADAHNNTPMSNGYLLGDQLSIIWGEVCPCMPVVTLVTPP